MILKLAYQKLGSHYHCRVYSKHSPTGTFANLGNIIIDEHDFDALRKKNVVIQLEERGSVSK